jgi:dienelactone hydrolase
MTTLTRRALLLAAVFFATLPAFAADAETVEIIDHDWVDAKRSRDVPARLYWPAGAAAHKAVPLVVFSHGLGGSRLGYSYLGRHLATNGIASLHLQHVGSDRSLWAGASFTTLFRLRAAAHEDEAIARVQDLSFALDRLLGSATGQRIDATRIVAAGHSYGANTSLLAAGARVERGERVLDFRDPRIVAALVISAPPFYGEADLGAVLRHVQVPTLHVTTTGDEIRIPGYYSGAADRVAVFDATGGADKMLAVFAGGSHSIFTDRWGAGGVAFDPRVKDATKELALAFLRHVFDGDSAGLAQWGERWRGIVARVARPAG